MNLKNLHNPSWNDVKWSSRIDVLICFLKYKSSDIDLIMLNNAMACLKKLGKVET